MKIRIVVACASLWMAAASAQNIRPTATVPPPPAATPPSTPPPATPAKEEKPIVTKHAITINGKRLDYTATVGMMPIKNETTGEIEASMFYMAYTLDRPAG